ncbi:MAG: hypothetical protein ACRDRE_21985, partial [Pseudonocardiaceae bacterium]
MGLPALVHRKPSAWRGHYGWSVSLYLFSHPGKPVLEPGVPELIHRANGSQYLTGMGVFQEAQQTRRSFASVSQLYVCKRSRPGCRRHQR